MTISEEYFQKIFSLAPVLLFNSRNLSPHNMEKELELKLKYVGKIGDILGVRWSIANFLELTDSVVTSNKQKGKAFSLISPSFDMLAATWNLIIFPFNPNDYRRNRQVQYVGPSYNYASISLKRECSNNEAHDLLYKLHLEADGSTFQSFTGNVCFQANGRDTTQKISVQHIDMRQIPNPRQLSSNIVTVLLYIFPRDFSIPRAVSYSNSNKREGVDQLSSEIQKLYLEGQDCDLKLRVQTKEFSVHRAILSARSPVLYSMLHHDMAEKNTGIVDIVDFEPDIFNDFLLYLYSGRVDDLSWKNVTKLFALSDKYDLQHLKKTCREYMLHEICEEQFCDVVELAIKYEEKGLLKRSEEFFVKNVKSIIITKQWQELMDKNSTVCNELFIKAVSKIPSE